jgi:restriction system protein
MQSKADSLNRLYTDHAICGRTMPIPDFQTMMLPFLEIIRDGRLYTMQEVINQLAIRYHLTPEERYQRSPNSANVVFNNKIGWTKTHLKNAQLIENKP